MQLRPYQSEALAAVLSAMRDERFILLQAATGAGKTILFSELIRRCMTEYSMRVGVIAHREVLVRQARDKLLKVWPEGRGRIGMACASAEKHMDVEAPVIIGSPQTLVKRFDSMPPLHLVIIDECHRVPPRNEKSQYRELIERLTDYYPKLRVLGVTATPYRLGHGMIYGDMCRPGAKNWWERLQCSIGISELQEQGYLVPMRAKEAEDIDADLEDVRTDKGEFNTADLSGLMERDIHVGSAVAAWEQYGEGRVHVVAFAVTISHAEKLAAAFRSKGIEAGCVHSGMTADARRAALDAFERGETRVICNVGVLTEGWDCTAVDCMLMCRPTMSPALYVQMIGRGLRPHPGKEDCLVLDLSGNCRRHGDPDHPIVDIPTGGRGRKRADRMKTCERCAEMCPPDASVCPACGWAFPEPEASPPVAEHAIDTSITMTDVHFGPHTAEVLQVIPPVAHVSKAGNVMLKLTLLCALPGRTPITVNQFMDIEGMGSLYGQSRARMLWRRLAGTEPPETVAEARERAGELNIPDYVELKQDGRYWKVARWS